MIDIDGSIMEGGGQVLRMATSYSAVLGESIRVNNIRSKRSQPGLKPQHLTTLRAAAKISNAKIRGDYIGSSKIVFEPGRLCGGDYSFDIGTAGSVSLMLQCLTPILLYADDDSSVSIKGGTAVKWSPPVAFLEHVVYEAFKAMGGSLDINVQRHGFYPKGGGEVTQKTKPVDKLTSLTLGKPKIKGIRGLSLCGSLPRHVAMRQAKAAEEKLGELDMNVNIKWMLADPEPFGPGSFICLWAEGSNIYLGADSLGARGKPAEKVGEEAASLLITDIRKGANMDQHTTDHMILPASLAQGESVFKTSHITLHTLTAIELAKQFTDAWFKVDGKQGESGVIRVCGIGLGNR
ncbi:RNA 3'-terminal phosphate cyclase [Candidatus Bathyarchaeota archaeon]|nr:RNA 3'-terminal phosphate cyclase [Candidatus Bathyarchaeota archaeon]